MVDVFAKLKEVENMNKLVDVVGQAQTLNESIFYLRSVDMLVLLHEKKGPVKKVDFFHLVPAAIIKGKKMVIISPIDYAVLYDEDFKIIDQIVEESRKKTYSGTEIWVEGLVPEDIRKDISEKGITIEAQAFDKLQ